MWKYVVAFVVIFGLTVYVTLQNQRIAEQDARQAVPIANGSVTPNAQGNHVQEVTKIPKQITPFWFRFFTWPEGITAWAILLTLLAIAEQTKETAKAAEASRVSANAALLNIQAFINSERPWIQVVAERQRDGWLIWDVKAMNRGRTPAAIISESFNYCIVGNLEFPSQPPKYEHPTVHSEHKILLPGEQLTLRTLTRNDLGLDGDSEQRRLFDSCEREAYIFGVVSYRDVLGSTTPPHETRWCLVGQTWEEGRGILIFDSNVDGYTKHT